jgi:hypothetical protein
MSAMKPAGAGACRSHSALQLSALRAARSASAPAGESDDPGLVREEAPIPVPTDDPEGIGPIGPKGVGSAAEPDGPGAVGRGAPIRSPRSGSTAEANAARVASLQSDANGPGLTSVRSGE